MDLELDLKLIEQVMHKPFVLPTTSFVLDGNKFLDVKHIEPYGMLPCSSWSEMEARSECWQHTA